MPQNESPLDLDDLQKIDEALALVREAQTKCVKAAGCGYDVTAQNLFAEAIRQRLEAVKHHFGPTRRE